MNDNEQVIEQCEWMLEFDGKTVWNKIRGWLKKNGYRRYYNRIPQIIDRLGYIFMEGYTYAKYLAILDDFEKMHYKFNRELRKETVVYFPNLRYICFRLMEKYGISYTFHVPMVRTKRKQKRLDELWFELNKDL